MLLLLEEKKNLMFWKTTGQLVFWWDTGMQGAGIREHMDSMIAKRHLRKALHSTVAGVPWSTFPLYVWLRASTCSLETNFLGGNMHMLIPCTSNGSMKGSTGSASRLWQNKDVGRLWKSGEKCGKLHIKPWRWEEAQVWMGTGKWGEQEQET